jgi:hypothetical protein
MRKALSELTGANRPLTVSDVLAAQNPVELDGTPAPWTPDNPACPPGYELTDHDAVGYQYWIPSPTNQWSVSDEDNVVSQNNAAQLLRRGYKFARPIKQPSCGGAPRPASAIDGGSYRAGDSG